MNPRVQNLVSGPFEQMRVPVGGGSVMGISGVVPIVIPVPVPGDRPSQAELAAATDIIRDLLGIAINNALGNNDPFSHTPAPTPNVMSRNAPRPITAFLTGIGFALAADIAIDTIRTSAEQTSPKAQDKAERPSHPGDRTITDQRVPDTGEPGSITRKVDKNGRLITERHYGPDKRPIRDIDHTDHGNPRNHPHVPHQHHWDWSNPSNPRGPDLPMNMQ
ncbi:MAG: hypothetical protein FWC73_12915 [Defluviitaleaceae bacterium]|nr:hypothetical protein [Defluviitaleaceae bacterium]